MYIIIILIQFIHMRPFTSSMYWGYQRFHKFLSYKMACIPLCQMFHMFQQYQMFFMSNKFPLFNIFIEYIMFHMYSKFHVFTDCYFICICICICILYVCTGAILIQFYNLLKFYGNFLSDNALHKTLCFTCFWQFQLKNHKVNL